ncbi:UNVERIFIED_CONTAM: hypothetical protein GTU68_039352 [Idotea baltica]|nr:hypothetical protein [Idotea baltica]
MLDKDAISIIIDILQPDSFYQTGHVLIYKAMRSLFEKSMPIDLLTVNEELSKAGDLEIAGGTTYLVDLSNKVGSAANVEFHARIISQKYIQRELIRVSTEIINDSYEDSKDIFELLDDAEQNLFEITDKNLKRNFETLSSLTIEARKQIEEASKQTDGLTGVPSGFTGLDRLTSGWQKSDLIIIAARPGMGKTAFTLALAANAAKDYKKPIAIFSLEMSNIQLVQRLMSMESEISGQKLRNGQLEEYEWQQLNRAMERLDDVPIFIDDTPAINIFELRAKARRLKMQHDIQMIVIDYLQLMTGTPDQKNKGNREQEISTISRSLKSLAKELGVPVIALSQLSRAVESRGGPKRPMLSDLRESGAIEQDADIVTFIYRPDYYDMDAEDDTPEGLTEIIIAKHRNGALDTVNLKFIAQYAKFVDMDNADFTELPNDFPAPENNIITRRSKMDDDGAGLPF